MKTNRTYELSLSL